MHACIPSSCFFFRNAVETGKTCLALFYCHRNWKWQPALASLTPWQLHWACERNEKRRRTKLAKRQLWLGWPAQRPLRPRERRNQGCFLKFELSRGVVPGCFFHRSLWIPLRWGSENIHKYVDLTGYLQLKSSVCSKMPPTAVLSIFLHKPMAGPALSDRFSPAVLFPRRFLGFSLYWSTGKFKKKRSSLLELTTLFGFRLYKRKIGRVCSNKTIHGEKVKSDQKTLCTCHRISGYVVSLCLSWQSDVWLRRYYYFSRRPLQKLVCTNSVGIKGLKRFFLKKKTEKKNFWAQVLKCTLQNRHNLR